MFFMSFWVRLRLWTLRFLAIWEISRFRRTILSCAVRRSSSNCFSPEPLAPFTPPRCWERSAHLRCNLGKEYWSCANWTWSFASLVFALFANICKIISCLSTTAMFRASSRFLWILGLMGLLKTIRLHSNSWAFSIRRFTWPVPRYVALLNVLTLKCRQSVTFMPRFWHRAESSSDFRCMVSESVECGVICVLARTWGCCAC